MRDLRPSYAWAKAPRSRGPFMTAQQCRLSLCDAAYLSTPHYQLRQDMAHFYETHPDLWTFYKSAMRQFEGASIPMEVASTAHGLEQLVSVTFRHARYGWDLYLPEIDFLSTLAWKARHAANCKLYPNAHDPLTFEVDIRKRDIPFEQEYTNSNVWANDQLKKSNIF